MLAQVRVLPLESIETTHGVYTTKAKSDAANWDKKQIKRKKIFLDLYA